RDFPLSDGRLSVGLSDTFPAVVSANFRCLREHGFRFPAKLLAECPYNPTHFLLTWLSEATKQILTRPFDASPSNRGKNRFVLSTVAEENKKCTIDVNFMRFDSFLTGQIRTFAPE
ncbi:MAG: hypothetical protein ACI3X4_08860, partial [Bacteroidaceae bacterium]